MTQPVNRVASGLLSFFQTKALGENPSRVEEVVRPTIDLLNFYMTNIGPRIENVTEANVAQSNLGTSIATIEVPAAEIWMVRGTAFSMTVNTAQASATAFGQQILQTVTGGGTENITLCQSASDIMNLNAIPIADDSRVHSRWFDTPLFLTPGSQVVCSIYWNVGSNLQTWDFVNRVFYYPIEV